MDSKGSALLVNNALLKYRLAYLPPLYPFFLAASYLLFGETWFGIAVSLSIICGLVGFVAFLVGNKLFSNAAGILADLWVSFYPYYFSGAVHQIFSRQCYSLYTC
jgi:4-amino-4-deoxy-L-arabinose transferase-like glycosyltransferase